MILRILMLLCTILLSMVTPAVADQPQALILHDGQERTDPEGFSDGVQIGNLLGHFNYHPKIQKSVITVPV